MSIKTYKYKDIRLDLFQISCSLYLRSDCNGAIPVEADDYSIVSGIGVVPTDVDWIYVTNYSDFKQDLKKFKRKTLGGCNIEFKTVQFIGYLFTSHRYIPYSIKPLNTYNNRLV